MKYYLHMQQSHVQKIFLRRSSLLVWGLNLSIPCGSSLDLNTSCAFIIWLNNSHKFLVAKNVVNKFIDVKETLVKLVYHEYVVVSFYEVPSMDTYPEIDPSANFISTPSTKQMN